MLFSEFQENTQCKDNAHNHIVYERLELIYLHDDSMTKAEVYEWGKKLVDNSKTEEELRLEDDIKAQIMEYKKYIADCREKIKQYQQLLETEDSEWCAKNWKCSIKYLKEDIKYANSKITQLNWVLGA